MRVKGDIEEYGEERVASLMLRLPEWRMEKALAFKYLSGRRECTLSYLLLADMLHKGYGIVSPLSFSYNAHGKPSLEDCPDIHFSLSHCRTAVACLVCDLPCGVDVECIRKAKPALVEYCMNKEECGLVFRSATPDVTFTELWTRKEAVFKLLGTGITGNVKDILSPENLAGIRLRTLKSPDESFVVTEALLTSSENDVPSTQFPLQSSSTAPQYQ